MVFILQTSDVFPHASSFVQVLKLDNFQPTDFDPLWTLGGNLSVAGVQFACDFLTEFEKASNKKATVAVTFQGSTWSKTAVCALAGKSSWDSAPRCMSVTGEHTSMDIYIKPVVVFFMFCRYTLEKYAPTLHQETGTCSVKMGGNLW